MLDPTTVTILSFAMASFGVGAAFGGAVTRWLTNREGELARSGKTVSWNPRKKWALMSVVAVVTLVVFLEILVTV